MGRKALIIIGLLIVCAVNAKAQVIKTYEKEWKRVGNFIKKNLPKSAVEEVMKIYTLAKKENQDAQVIKSLVFMTGLQSENRENNEILSIKEFEAELVSAKEPAASIIRSLLAELYWDYYQQHRWQLYQRTITVDFKKEDIATWGTEDLHRRISELFLQSIRSGKLLQQTKLESFDAIIIKGNARSLRPTLYDLLISRALDYFENDERDIKKPAYAFELDQSSVFDPASEFVKHKFSTSDTTSLQFKALLLYQEWIAFHLNDNRPEALIDADLQRISFVNTNSTHPDKDQLYFNAINQIANKYDMHPAAAQAWYLLAAWYNDKAGTYKPFGDTTHRFDRVKAKEICEKVLQQKTNSEGKINCSNLLNQINQRRFEFTLEKVNVPQQPFRVFVEYRNVSKLYLRIIRADQKLKDLLQSQSADDKYWPLLTASVSLKNWQQNLPATFDYQEHNTEIKTDGLTNGEYILLASDQSDFNTSKAILGARLFYVSNISYANTGNEFFVLHRENGSPLSKAQVQVWEQRYDYKQYKWVRDKGKSYSTDKNGYFRMEKRTSTENDRYSYNYSLEINYNNDRLFVDDMSEYYYSNQPQEIKPNTNIYFFTDRSLYRPGQMVFFKGIAIIRTVPGRTGAVNAGYETTVYLRDANYKTIDSLKVKTGEFGSFSGRFNLPSSGLTGSFSIYAKDEDDISTEEFKVEEYKRPKFYVDFEPVKGTYKVNDKIKVIGFAKAYAGNVVDEAMIKYRVVRKPRYIYPWISWRWWQPPVQEMEIAHGEMKTGKDGKFNIEFTAIPDRKIDKKLEPVFDYMIYADVTDINGETRSAEKLVSVSYKSLMVVTRIPETIPIDSLDKIYIRTQNMNGEYEPAVVTVRAFRLKEEKRLIRDRYWERPDQFVMTKNEYIAYFPHDEYDNETDYKSWEKGAVVFEKKDSAKESGEWQLAKGNFSPGVYMIEIITKDKSGEEVKDIKYAEIYDEKSASLVQPSYLWAGFKKNFAEPGEMARILWGTSADSLFVIQQVNRNQNLQVADHDFSFLAMSKEKRNFTFPITENDRGAFPVNWMFIRHNRLYQLNESITVPWTNKELTIDYSSFREKTLPGSTEKWKLRITGLKKDKVAAELLAGMYDASLDQFYPHEWQKPWIWYAAYTNINWNGNNNFARISSRNKTVSEGTYSTFDKVYDDLLTSYLFTPSYRNSIDPLFWENPLNYTYSEFRNPRLMRLPKPVLARGADGRAPELQEVVVAANQVRKKDGDRDADGVEDKIDKEPQKIQQDPSVQIRKNFNETAFFFPELRTDSTGAIEFSFTIPEALTKWKFMALAHTKEAAFGLSTKEIITQKDLMVQPNAPRFMREGDKMEFSSKIVNMTDKEITGTAEFQLFDATTNEPVDGRFRNMVPNQYFTVGAGQSEVVKFPIEIPFQFNRALVWRIVAKAGNFSDGEENTLPVLTNRMLVTETLPLNMRTEGSKNFSFAKLLQSGNSETLQHFGLTVEYTSNPAWYAVQALPYLMEYPYECAEQTWNRYYANSLATYISNANPKIKAVFEKWKITDTTALMSNLQKNQELKSVLLEETPWVMQAKTEAEQKRNIALLFDMVRMSSELNKNFEKLKQMQSSNGGFVWFKGGPDDRYMTQYIVTGIGHLMHLKGVAANQYENLKSILKNAIPYLDKKIKDDYDQLIKQKTDLKKYSPDYLEIQYLYMRSFFPDYPVAQASATAYNYFKGRLSQSWTSQSKYMQAMIALVLYRSNDLKTSNAILASLKQTAVVSDEMGMYYKDMRAGWFWHEAPIETQALLIEAFQEAGNDSKTVDDLKTWLLKNKQTNNWRTTKATAEACYALLLQGSNWISNEPVVTIKLGNTTFSTTDNKQEAGTGYFKSVIDGNKVKPEMGNVSVTVTPLRGAGGPSGGQGGWGAVYWQYFEDLDKITTASTPLKLVKKLFIEKNSDRGPVLTPVNDGDVLHVGDKIKVRIELRADRDMEYIHMKDMRAASLEPVNVLSGYKWQGGLGYYESTRDASTNFFFNYLPKGVYVFEYPLFVTHTGNFSNGVTSIQCMYAPEFSSHSEGIRITVE